MQWTKRCKKEKGRNGGRKNFQLESMRRAKDWTHKKFFYRIEWTGVPIWELNTQVSFETEKRKGEEEFLWNWSSSKSKMRIQLSLENFEADTIFALIQNWVDSLFYVASVINSANSAASRMFSDKKICSRNFSFGNWPFYIKCGRVRIIIDLSSLILFKRRCYTRTLMDPSLTLTIVIGGRNCGFLDNS